MKIRLAVLASISAVCAFGGYTYDYANPWFYYLGTSTFAANGGGLGATVYSGTYLYQSWAGAGSDILIPSVSGNANDYEVNAQLSIQAGSGTLIEFLRASSNALAASGSCTGSYISVELAVPPTYAGGVIAPATLSINQCVSGTQSSLGGFSVAVANGSTLRSVIYGTSLLLYLNNNLVASYTVPSTSGQPGVGGYGMTGGIGFPYDSFTGDAMIMIGHHDTVAPNTVSATGLSTSIFPTRASLQWQGVTDDTNGIGVYGYTVARNGTTIGNVDGAEFADSTVSAATTYTYSIAAIDFHGNTGSAATFSVTTPPATAVDPRRTGVAATGSYWGGGGEQIDMLSGNLNFSLPLLSAQGRAGWKVPVGLSYNSQNWRQDGGTNWQLGTDVGYGYGWSLQVGSITPFYGYGPDHYVFTDGTGAKYLLNQNSGGIWSSTQSAYVWFDASANILHFKNGMFWYMGCTSGGAEQDAGTMYPTVIEDAGGNQVLITYSAAPSLPAADLNTSGRINWIYDVRNGNYPAYAFTYSTSTPVPHLTSISNGVNTPESYTFTYTAGAGLMPPFGTDPAYSGLTTTQLSAISVPVAGSYGFTYDSAGASELLEAQFPWGGHLRWTYANASYAGSRLLREVNDRYMYSSATTGGTEYGPYPITHSDSGVSGGIPIVHSDTTLVDASGVGAKKWTFNNSSGSAWQIGLVSQFTQLTSASGTAITQDTYTWSQTTASNPYISTKVSVKDPGASYAASAETTQTQDQYGNTTQTLVYPYNNTSTPLATYNSTFVTTSGYISNYVRGLLASSSVTVGSTTTTLVTDTYDGCLSGPSGGTAPTYEFDAAPTSSDRGYLTSSTTIAGTSTACFYWYGIPYLSTPAGGATTNLSVSSATNFTAPDTVTTPATISTPTFTNTLAYDSWIALTSATGPNGATMSMTYDTMGRPATATSPYGAVTNYAYSSAGTVPAWQSSTGPGGYSKTTLDGFGRPVLVQSGTSSSAIVSQTSTVYAPCACSPLGKIQAVSQPYAPGATVYSTSYTYDGIGRTLATVLPDGASTTSYSYAGNTTTVMEPTGMWKTFTSDVSGNLTSVLEPNPAGGTQLTTSYTYDWMNHLVGTSMTRGSTTQTRTFVYNTAGQLTSATNPESGTVAYTYNSDTTLNTKQDAKGQVTLYTYDPLKRVIETQMYPSGLSYGEDICQRVTYAYDAGTNGLGHLTSTQYGAPPPTYPGWQMYTTCPGTASPHAYQESYTYVAAGGIASKTFALTTNVPSFYSSISTAIGVGYTYDSAGRLLTENYPQTSYYATPGFPSYGPTAPTYTYSYDGMGRPAAMIDSLSNPYTGLGTPWVQNGQYDAAGRMTSMTLFSGGFILANPGAYWAATSQNMTYNANGQLTSLNWAWLPPYNLSYSETIGYAYSGTNNNGQITQMSDGFSGETVSYAYDPLKRLVGATAVGGSTPWNQTFGYDGFGNLTSKVLNGGTNSAPAVDPTTNRLTSSYDANGNMLSGMGGALTYDEENRLASATPTWSMTEYYGYAPDNKRIYRLDASGNEEWTFYGARGERIGTFALNLSVSNLFSATETNIWFGGALITKMDSLGYTKLVQRDRLGSERYGAGPYLPYGEEVSTTANGTEKFGTYFRDSFTGMDYADQRYYASSYGRFNTPDRGRSERSGNPGSWNRYSYALGDPVNGNDPRGLYVCNDGVYDDSDTEWTCSYDGGIDPVASANENPYCDGGCGGGGGWTATGTAVADPDPVIDPDPCASDPEYGGCEGPSSGAPGDDAPPAGGSSGGGGVFLGPSITLASQAQGLLSRALLTWTNCDKVLGQGALNYAPKIKFADGGSSPAGFLAESEVNSNGVPNGNVTLFLNFYGNAAQGLYRPATLQAETLVHELIHSFFKLTGDHQNIIDKFNIPLKPGQNKSEAIDNWIGNDCQ